MELQFLRRVTRKEKAFFTRQLATMLKAGLSLVRSLNIIRSQTRNRYFEEILADITQRLEEGYPLSQSLARYPNVFDEVYVAIIKAGEASGKLEKVLGELAESLEEENRLTSAVYNALLYPVFVLVAMVLVGIYVVSRIIPQLKELFAENQAQLPWVTQMLIAFSDFFNRFWYIILLLLIIGVVVLRMYLKTPSGRLLWSTLQLKIPGVNRIFEGLHMTQFCRTFGMLSASGIPIIDAVGIVGGVMSNVLYRDAMTEVAHQLELGIPMSTPISKNPWFPPLVGQMILVGEQTGRLDEVFFNLASYYETETTNKIKGLASLLEPVLIVIVGAGVAFMVFAVLIPVYQISQVVG